MALFEMPEFYLPFAAKSNPNVAATREHSKAWAHDMGMLVDSAQDILIWNTSEYDATDFASFAALTNPTAPGAQLDLISDWHVWGYFFDDFFVKVYKHSRDLAGAKAFLDRLPAFTPLYGTITPVPVNPVERGLADTWARTVPDLSAGERRQLARGVHTMVRSWLWELFNLVHDRVPDPIDYIEMRRQTGGIQFAVDTAQLGLDVSIPAEILRSRPLRRLTDVFADVACLANDIFSYQKETEFEGEINNGVLIVHRFLDCELQHAVGVVNDILTSRMHQFEDIVATDLPALFDEQDLDTGARDEVLTYARTLQDWTAGFYQWGLGNARYDEPTLWAPLPDRSRTAAQVLNGPTGLGTGAARISLLTVTQQGPVDPPRTEERHRAIVIGSGFGGAVAAYRLAQAGVQTVVLERGRRWPIAQDGSTFPKYFSPDRRSSWLTPGPVCEGQPPVLYKPYVGLFERVYGTGIDALCGAGVGGSSLVYGGVMLRPSEKNFATVMPPIVDYSEMIDKYYPRVERNIGVAPIPTDILAHDNYHSTRLFVERSTQAGFCPEFINQATDWDIVRAELRGDAVPAASVGEHLSGINSGARNSLDRNYLALAEQSGTVTIRPLHVVTAIGTDGQGRYLVDVDHIDEDGNVRERKVLVGDALFLGAGSMGTSRLLVRARETGSLARLNEHVGRHWGNNGARACWLTLPFQETGTHQGGPTNVVICDWGNPRGPVTIEHIGVPLPAETHMLSTPGIGICRPYGRFVYSAVDDAVYLHWPGDADLAARQAILSTLHRLSTPSGAPLTVGSPVAPGLGGTPAGVLPTERPVTGGTGGVLDFVTGTSAGLFDLTALSPLTGHPLGGAVLTKVCDGYGRVHGYRGLYVTDGALIPGSAGACNPALTVAALAERCMEDIVRKDVGALF